MFFDGSEAVHVDSFLFYTKNVAEAESEGEARSRAVMCYLRGEEF